MYARVARWEGADAASQRQAAQMINSSSGPPPGVPAKGIMMLVDEAAGTSLSITLFESEADLRQGDEALNAMSPQVQGSGRRISVETYEVTVDRRT